MKAVIVVLPEDCRSGLCDCEGAQNCKFPRCTNCDEITKDGKWIEDDEWHGEDPDICPDCGAPMERR